MAPDRNPTNWSVLYSFFTGGTWQVVSQVSEWPEQVCQDCSSQLCTWARNPAAPASIDLQPKQPTTCSWLSIRDLWVRRTAFNVTTLLHLKLSIALFFDQNSTTTSFFPRHFVTQLLICIWEQEWTLTVLGLHHAQVCGSPQDSCSCMTSCKELALSPGTSAEWPCHTCYFHAGECGLNFHQYLWNDL